MKNHRVFHIGGEDGPLNQAQPDRAELSGLHARRCQRNWGHNRVLQEEILLPKLWSLPDESFANNYSRNNSSYSRMSDHLKIQETKNMYKETIFF